VSQPLEISGLVPYLVLIWLGTLFVALANLAADEYRGEWRLMLSALCEWISVAGAVSIGTVLQEMNSQKLFSPATHVFLDIMLLAVVIAPRAAQDLARREADVPRRRERD
jgi:hypothetical protein